jgi:hypothetical protein
MRPPDAFSVTVLRTVLILVASAALISGFVRGQSQRGYDASTRSVTGIVTESNGKPASGAVVLLKDTKTLQVRSYVTKDDGIYRFFGLSMNDQYELRAQHNGVSSGSKTLSQFDSRKAAKIDLKLK